MNEQEIIKTLVETLYRVKENAEINDGRISENVKELIDLAIKTGESYLPKQSSA